MAEVPCNADGMFIMGLKRSVSQASISLMREFPWYIVVTGGGTTPALLQPGNYIISLDAELKK